MPDQPQIDREPQATAPVVLQACALLAILPACAMLTILYALAWVTLVALIVSTLARPAHGAEPTAHPAGRSQPVAGLGAPARDASDDGPGGVFNGASPAGEWPSLSPNNLHQPGAGPVERVRPRESADAGSATLYNGAEVVGLAFAPVRAAASQANASGDYAGLVWEGLTAFVAVEYRGG